MPDTILGREQFKSRYHRLDIRPSPKLRAAVDAWIGSLDHPIPLARAVRQLVWAGLKAEGIVPEQERKGPKRRVENGDG